VSDFFMVFAIERLLALGIVSDVMLVSPEL
jgi:hypothetical protein